MRNIFGMLHRRAGNEPREEAAPSGRVPPPTVARVSLSLSSEAPRTSRDYTTQVLYAGPALPSRLFEDVCVTVSELVTASYLAGASTVDLDIEIHRDHVAAIVRDDRNPAEEPPPNTLRDMLLDAMTTSRIARWDDSGFVNVVRFSTRSA